MTKDNLVELKTPETQETFKDALSELVRQGARQIIAQAVDAELSEFLEQYREVQDASGRQGVVRNGYLPERTMTTGIGEVSVKVPKVRDRTKSGIKFNSLLLPPYLKRTRSVEEVLPWLYLKGVSTGDFREALASLLGSEAKGLSAATISRLKAKWHQVQNRINFGTRFAPTSAPDSRQLRQVMSSPFSSPDTLRSMMSQEAGEDDGTQWSRRTAADDKISRDPSPS